MASFFLYLEKSAKDESTGISADMPDVKGIRYSWILAGKGFGIAVESAGTNDPGQNGKSPLEPIGFFADDESGSYIISDSRIDYRMELGRELGIDLPKMKGFSDSRLILSAYLKWGEECLSHLYGDFSFVIWDPRKAEVFCARDHFGCRPLYYVDQPGFLALASEIEAFGMLKDFSFEINEQYILDSLCTIVIKDSNSAFKGIYKLKPAHYLRFTGGQASEQRQYWSLKAKSEYQGLTLEEAISGLKDRLFEAVRQRSYNSDPIGVELSGGLDSSGIASVLTMLSDKKIQINAYTHTQSSGATSPFIYQKNEMEYCEALIEKYSSITHFEINGKNSEGSYKSLSEAIKRLHKPINLHYAINSDLLFKIAGNKGTTIILSGFGGDEGISNQGIGYFNELIRDIKSRIPHNQPAYLRHLFRLYFYYYLPGVSSLLGKDWRKAMYRSFAIHKDLARKYRMKKRFLSAPSFPVKADIRAMQYFRLMYPSIPARIEETHLLAKQYGIEYRYPLLDVKLIEYFYSLPSEYKYLDGVGRYLFRETMKEILPEKIRMRTDKSGTTIPNVFTRVLKDEKKFRETISEGRVENSYHYVDYDKLDAMLDSLTAPGAFKEEDFDLRAFQSAMSVLILQKWQREGKIDIGIK